MFKIKIDHMNLSQIANSGQCFRWQQISENTYKIPAFGKCLEISQDGDLFSLSCDENEWHEVWESYFDMNTDYNKVEQIIKRIDDKFLLTAYQFGSGIRILKQDLWETIVSFIISQNNNIPRIKKSIEKICGEFNGNFPDSYDILEMDLSDKGLGYRDKYLIDAISWWDWQDGYAASRLKYSKDPKKRLMEIKGVGNKVADCICLFSLHQLNRFPIDTHVRRILDREYGGELPAWIHSEYAGLFQQYIFYYELNHKN